MNLLKKLGFSPLEEQALVNEKKKYGMLIRDREERIEKLKSKLSNFELQYKDPIPNFDRSRVKGLVLNFFELVDPKFSIALEVAGGGKLWNIIVDNEETASLIFKNGNLNRTVTFLPLTKMKPHLLSESQINEALSIAPGEVNPALSLIKYDEQYAKAVEYVFGNVFICNSLKIAETITFDPNIKAPTVTTDGDIFDPSGTATGGSRPQSDNVLERISELKTQERELTDFIEKLNRVEERLQMIEDMSDTYRKLNLELELKTRELEYLQQRISQTPYNQLLQRYEEIKESILKEKNNIKQWLTKIEEYEAKIQDLNSQLSSFDQESQLHKAKKNIEEKKRSLSELNTKLQESQKSFISIKTELEQLQEELITTIESFDQLKIEIEKKEESLVKKSKELEELKKGYDEKKLNLEDKKSTFLATDSSISQLMSQRDSINKKNRGK